MSNFCVFILTHGRPDNVITLDALKKHGYSGPIYLLVDNEDKTLNQYYVKHGNKVIEFNKLWASKTFDEADNFEDRRAIVYARNTCHNIASELGYKYYLQLDDDYKQFEYRTIEGHKLMSDYVKNLDQIFSFFVNFLEKTKVHSVAMAQGGDFIGGANNDFVKTGRAKRKVMNSFFCSVDRPFKFYGRINEDVNTYTYGASIGLLFLTTPKVNLVQKMTQSNDGGMTDLYINKGTYIKSFYSILFHPSSVTISLMGSINKRLHHKINWEHTTPKIISEVHKKQKS